MVVRNSTVSGNTAGGAGGAIYSYDANLEVYQSTLSGNSAYSGGGAITLRTYSAYVGAPYEGFSTIERSTITANSSNYGGGGVDLLLSHSTTLSNSVVAGNFGYAGSEDIYAPAPGNVTNNFTIVGGDPMLSPLQDNGGPTLTHLPLPGSPVIDAADPLASGSGDQRGFEPRVVGAAMDAGSVESGAIGGSPCDVDNDGTCSFSDIDAVIGEIASGGGNLELDLNDDGVIDLGDRDAWLALAGDENLSCNDPYLLGDFNLDGVVDVSDFGIFNANKFTATGTWSGGDGNADGVTDVSDFGIFNANKFTSSCALQITSDKPTISPLNQSAQAGVAPLTEIATVSPAFSPEEPGGSRATDRWQSPPSKSYRSHSKYIANRSRTTESQNENERSRRAVLELVFRLVNDDS